MQLQGLAKALQNLHYPPIGDTEANWRHGDLKPENILMFRDPARSGSKLGTLRISDLGLAKRHIRETQKRVTPTTQTSKTPVYEPPEVHTQLNGPRSRIYDVWSMGCVIMEFIIWLLHGKAGLDSFRTLEYIHNMEKETFFYKIDEKGRGHVSDIASKWMEHLNGDLECRGDTALHDLLQLVKQGLLNVNIEKGGSKARIESPLLAKELNRICERARNEPDYRFTGTDRTGIPTPDPLFSNSQHVAQESAKPSRQPRHQRVSSFRS